MRSFGAITTTLTTTSTTTEPNTETTTNNNQQMNIKRNYNCASYTYAVKEINIHITKYKIIIFRCPQIVPWHQFI